MVVTTGGSGIAALKNNDPLYLEAGINLGTESLKAENISLAVEQVLTLVKYKDNVKKLSKECRWEY